MKNAPNNAHSGEIVPDFVGKICVRCSVNRPLDMFSRRAASKDGLAYTCKPCARAAASDYYKAHLKALRRSRAELDPEAYRLRATESRARRADKISAWNAANRDRQNDMRRRRRGRRTPETLAKDLEMAAEQMRRWRAANKEHHATWRASWAKKNAGRVRRYTSVRRARTRPHTADAAQMDALFSRAAELTSAGDPHDVDHIYPLKSRWVCGLHVPQNLRVVPASLNRSKRNRISSTCLHEFAQVPDHEIFWESGCEQ